MISLGKKNKKIRHFRPNMDRTKAGSSCGQRAVSAAYIKNSMTCRRGTRIFLRRRDQSPPLDGSSPSTSELTNASMRFFLDRRRSSEFSCVSTTPARNTTRSESHSAAPRSPDSSCRAEDFAVSLASPAGHLQRGAKLVGSEVAGDAEFDREILESEVSKIRLQTS